MQSQTPLEVDGDDRIPILFSVVNQGDDAALDPSIVDRIVQSGHTVSHTLSPTRAPPTLVRRPF